MPARAKTCCDHGGAEIGEPVGQTGRMGAAAERFAVRVEDDELDVREIVVDQQLSDTNAQPLDPEARRDLPDIAAGIGIAELDAEAAVAAKIVPPMRAPQRFVDDSRTLLQSFLGLEKRRDLDPVGDAEPARQPQGGEKRVAGLGLRHEKPHGPGRIEVLDDLRDGHQHARGGGAFRRERSEINRDRLDLVERAVDGGEERSAPGRLGRLAFNLDGPAHGIMELGRVQAEMRHGDRDAMGDASGLGEAERHAEIVVARLDQRAIERGDEPGCVRQGRLAFLNDDEREIAQGFKGRVARQAAALWTAAVRRPRARHGRSRAARP